MAISDFFPKNLKAIALGKFRISKKNYFALKLWQMEPIAIKIALERISSQGKQSKDTFLHFNVILGKIILPR